MGVDIAPGEEARRAAATEATALLVWETLHEADLEGDAEPAPARGGVLASRTCPVCRTAPIHARQEVAPAGVGPPGAGCGRPRPGGSATRRSGPGSRRHWRS